MAPSQTTQSRHHSPTWQSRCSSPLGTCTARGMIGLGLCLLSAVISVAWRCSTRERTDRRSGACAASSSLHVAVCRCQTFQSPRMRVRGRLECGFTMETRRPRCTAVHAGSRLAQVFTRLSLLWTQQAICLVSVGDL